MKATRPLLRWHGGKWRAAPRIIAHFPPHRVYVEPFGGAASVLLRKQPAYAEVWNDLDGEAVNLFRILRSTDAARLVAALRLTPFAREEFEAAYEPSPDPLERARRLVVRSFQGFGSGAAINGYRTGFRSDSNKSGTTPAHDWANYPPQLEAIIARLTGVVIENREATRVIEAHDRADTLFYVDPPYVAETRSQKKRGAGLYHAYRHELTDADHGRLLDVLRAVRGMVVLSGYPHPLYDDALADWARIEWAARADGARPRTEVLWLNPACAGALSAGGLFREAAA